MKKISDFVNSKKTLLFIIALVLTAVLAAVTVFKNISDPDTLKSEALNALIPIVGSLVGTFLISKIVPNKRFVSWVMLIFSAAIAIFMILNILILDFSGAVVSVPLCIFIFLMTSAKCYGK